MQYKSHHFGEESNNSFAVKIETLVREIIIQNEIPYYRIESGVEHLTHAGAEENLPVIRIITYFEDTVNKISHILHEEFDVDIELSVDKKKIRIETFAYKNINYTATLTTTRQNQTEYKRSGDKKFEIQICSMLQDAWTGIEKELGYDTNFVPDEAKRDFYRVGALLEMADIEFLKIRTELGRKINAAATAAPQKTEQPLRENVAREIPREAPVTAPKAEVAEEIVDSNANSFLEHLQSVAREVQKEPVPVATHHVAPPVATVAPVQEFSNVLPPQPEVPAAEEPVPQPVMQQAPPVPAPAPQPVVATPPPVAQQPVYTPPPARQPVTTVTPQVQQPVQAPPPPVAQPVYTPPAVAAQAPASAPAPQPIAPKPFTASPFGIAPKPIHVPKPEPVPNRIAGDIGVNNLKELANSINSIEHKATPAPKQEPVAKEPVIVIPPAISELPKPAPEVITPVIEKIVSAAPQAPVTPVAENIGNIAVASNGVANNATEKALPSFNDQPKAAKTVLVDDSTQMTDASLREFVMTSKIVKEVDQKIAERAGAKINSDIDIEGDVERLRFLKVFTLKQLQDRITDNKEDIVAFAEKWIGKDNGGSFDSGICLFYLEYLLVGKRNDPAFAVEYVVKFISDNDYSARYIIPTYNSIHNTEAPNFSHLTLRA